MASDDLDRLIALLGRVPGLGPRSARRAALGLLKQRDSLLRPLAETMQRAADSIQRCTICRNLDTADPCAVCRDPTREGHVVCVVEEVEDLWALERAGAFTGRYHVLAGTLSAIDGIGPDELGIDALRQRLEQQGIEEVILALGATVDGQTTAHYLAETLARDGLSVTRLAHGIPVGGELNYLDDGTLHAALQARSRY